MREVSLEARDGEIAESFAEETRKENVYERTRECVGYKYLRDRISRNAGETNQ